MRDSRFFFFFCHVTSPPNHRGWVGQDATPNTVGNPKSTAALPTAAACHVTTVLLCGLHSGFPLLSPVCVDMSFDV